MQNESENQQAATLRFILTNIDLKLFSKWITELDKDTNITTVDNTGDEIHLSTAYTWDDNRKWALEPIFKEAVKNGDLTLNDSAT